MMDKMTMDTKKAIKAAEQFFSPEVCTIEACPASTQGCEGKKAKKMRYRYDCEESYDSCGECSMDYIENRMDGIRCEKDVELQIQFNIREDKPKTVADFVARISAGDYQVHSDEFIAARQWWNPESFIIWRKPGVKEDQVGYQAAIKAMQDAYSEAVDKVKILKSDTAKLDALNAFKAWTYAPAA